MRCVFDTNTVVSGLLFEQSKPGRALLRAFQHGEILLSQSTLEELADVLLRRKFDRYVTGSEREEFLEAFVTAPLGWNQTKRYVCAAIPRMISFWSWLSGETLTL